MTTFVVFALLGLGSGAIYALAALGVTATYRGSGVLNFAHGAIALLGASVFVSLWDGTGIPLFAAIIAAVVAAAAVGGLVHVLIMRPLRDAAPLVRTIATLGVLVIVQQSVSLWMGTGVRQVATFLPVGSWELSSGVRLGYDRVLLVAIAVLATVSLWAVGKFTRFGLAVQAVSEQRLVAAALGHAPDRISLWNWVIGGALAGAAGVLIVPISGLAPLTLVLLVIPAFAAALPAGFRLYGVTLLVALLLGMGQSVIVGMVDQPGLSDALPFLVIVAVLVIRGNVLPARDEIVAALPHVGRTSGSLWRFLPWLGFGVALGALASNGLAEVLITTAVVALVALSLVVITGLGGQLSLAQFAIAGAGAFAAGKVSGGLGWPFPVAALVGVAAAVGFGLIMVIPASRTRGIALGIATLATGLALDKVVFSNADYVGGFSGTPVHRPEIAGVPVSPITHPQRYAVVCIVVLWVAALLVARLRAGRGGRRLLALRANERGTAALGISAVATKVWAFGLASVIAGIAGVLMAFRYDTIQFQQFGFFASIQILTLVLIGGVGYVLGGVIGAVALPGGLLVFFVSGVADLDRYAQIGAGVLLIVVLIWFPDGVAHAITRGLHRAKSHRRPSTEPVRNPTPASTTPPAHPGAEPRALVVRNLTVHFGAVVAVDDVSLTVEPGRIVGLIGANGAGKTTLIDAVTGFVPTDGGTVILGTADLTRRNASARARAGIGRCFQSVELFDDMTVRENLLVAAERLRWWEWFAEIARPTPASRADAGSVESVVASLDLSATLDAYPLTLPHGDRRLVGVARALVGDPSVLLLDEPAAGLDDAETRHLGTMIAGTAANRGIGVLLIEHHLGLVTEICDELVVLDRGHVIYRGDPDGLANDATVRAAYLGTEAPSQPTTDGEVAPPSTSVPVR